MHWRIVQSFEVCLDPLIWAAAPFGKQIPELLLLNNFLSPYYCIWGSDKHVQEMEAVLFKHCIGEIVL